MKKSKYSGGNFMTRLLKIASVFLVVALLQCNAGFAQTINNNNANTQPQQQQQGFGGWGGWMAFLPFPLPPIPLPFFGGFGMGNAGAGQQGTNNNQNVVVNGGGSQENTQMMEMMKQILELLKKRQSEENASDSYQVEGSEETASGTAVQDTTENESQTGEGALNE